MLLLFVVPWMVSCDSADEVRLNVLFIAIDDLKPELGCYGAERVISPNIDAIAEEGTVFLNNHCQQAVCGPSRASLLTGMYPDQIRIWGFDMIRERNPDIVTLPQHFKNHGYTTVNISKIFDYRTVDKGMDTISWSWPYFPMGKDMESWYAEETGPVAAYFYQSEKVKRVFEEKQALAREQGGNPNQMTHELIKPATECLDVPDHAYKDGVFALKAMEDLEILSGTGQPFFLAVGFERPHLPWTAPKKYWDMYERDEIDLASFRKHAANDKDYFYTTSNELRSYSDEDGEDAYGKLADGIPLSDSVSRQLIHGYLAATTYIDAQVGMIMARLDSLGLKENTIVVVWGDHGWHLGDHGIWGKATNFEQATRSPMIISAPGIDPGRTAVPTEFVDIFPTLCDLAGIPYRDSLAGGSVRSLMEGKTTGTEYAYSQYTREDRMGYAIRSDRFRYVEWIAEGPHTITGTAAPDFSNVADTQFFDYKEDPMEKVNVSGFPKYEEQEAKLADALARWREELWSDR